MFSHMKKQICALLFIYFYQVFALDMTIEHPCNPQQSLKDIISIQDKNISVGEITTRYLISKKISYSGNERGINSIFDTPTGDDALYLINDGELYAFGWCYSVNEITPELFPDSFIVKQNDQIHWWFGVAHYSYGEWVSQCRKLSHNQRALICPL